MKECIEQTILHGERALFNREDLRVVDSVFADGESPLKECRRIEVEKSIFKWMYPVWYCRDVRIQDSTWFPAARAGVWYTDAIDVENCVIEAPKNFRRCTGVSLKDVSLTNAAETLWNCKNVVIDRVCVKGEYFAMNCEDLEARDLTLVGGYSFDGVRNAEIRNARLLTKDAFWNSENVTVYDSFISSRYLGWNAKNLTLVNCTVESLQGMCYVDNLVMKDCTLLNTDLAFEYSTVDVTVKGNIESIKNPRGGIIRADSIGKIILEDDTVDPAKTTIVCRSEQGSMQDAI